MKKCFKNWRDENEKLEDGKIAKELSTTKVTNADLRRHSSYCHFHKITENPLRNLSSMIQVNRLSKIEQTLFGHKKQSLGPGNLYEGSSTLKSDVWVNLKSLVDS